MQGGVAVFHRRPDSFEGTFQIDESGTWTDDPVQASGRVDSEPSRRFEYTQPFAIRCASAAGLNLTGVYFCPDRAVLNAAFAIHCITAFSRCK